MAHYISPILAFGIKSIHRLVHAIKINRNCISFDILYTCRNIQCSNNYFSTTCRNNRQGRINFFFMIGNTSNQCFPIKATQPYTMTVVSSKALIFPIKDTIDRQSIKIGCSLLKSSHHTKPYLVSLNHDNPKLLYPLRTQPTFPHYPQ